MHPARRAPCCSIVRRLVPATGIPHIASADWSPVAGYPFIANRWHRRGSLITNGGRGSSNGDADRNLTKCRGCKNRGGKKTAEDPFCFHVSPSLYAPGFGTGLYASGDVLSEAGRREKFAGNSPKLS